MIVPISDHLKTLPLKPAVPLLILVFLNSVLPAIHFDNDLLLKGNKVNDVRTYLLLSTKLQVLQLFVSEFLPKSSFRIG